MNATEEFNDTMLEDLLLVAGFKFCGDPELTKQKRSAVKEWLIENRWFVDDLANERLDELMS